MKKDLLDNNVLPLSPETINEVTVGGADDPFLPSANKKSQMQQGPADKEKKKGVLSGEAYSRAVDRSVLLHKFSVFRHLFKLGIFNLKVEEGSE